MTADRPLLGILLMLGFCVLAPLGDGIAKLLGETMAILQILIARFAVQAVVLAPLVWAQSKSLRFSRRIWRLTVQRTVLHIIGIGAMFTSLRYLPLADAIAIAFVMPFIMLLLGRFILGEQVGPHRLAACAVGFVGTLLVIQPNFVDVGAAALLPLLVAVVFALFMLTTRQMAKEVDPVTLQAGSGTMATAMLLIGLYIASVFNSPSATLAPMQYLEIPFATLIGLFLFRDLPDGLAAIGIAITISAGLYIIMRERRLDRQATRSLRQPTPPAG